jgi:cell division protein FtsQ
MMGTGTGNRQGVNARRKQEHRKASRNERMTGATRWVVRKGFKLALIPLLVVLVGWLAWVGIQKMEFRKMVVLKHVVIEGNHLLSWDEVLGRAKVEMGTPMLDLRLDSIKLSLEKLDLIHKVSVERSFPSTLKVRIVEAEPLFMVSGEDGWVVFSDKGTRIPMRQDLGFQLPVVTLSQGQNMSIAVNLLRQMRNEEPVLFSLVSQVVVENAKWSEVYFRNVKSKALFSNVGARENVFHQYRLLTQSLGAQIQSASIIDMRFPGFAIASPVERENENG